MTVAFAAQALAAEALAAEASGHPEAFYEAPEFWVMVAFFIIVATAGKAVFRMITLSLDKRTETISNQIEQSTKLREEAQDLLASYERKQRDAVKEAEEIVERARAEADRQAAQSAEDLEKSLKRRQELAMERISQAEAKALEEVRAMTVDLTIDATRRLLDKNITAEKADAMIDEAIKELPGKLS